MDTYPHPFDQPFAQLGLPSDAAGIAQFIRTHRPLAGGVALPDAAFWRPAQAAFLREAWLEDADWANRADQLNAALRGQ